MNSIRVCCLVLVIGFAAFLQIALAESSRHHIFATDFFKTVTPERSNENVIYSPASIRSCFALAFMGAKGATADTMRSGLSLGEESKENIARSYGDFITKTFKTTKEKGPVLKMANAVYVNQALEVAPGFKTLAERDFNSNVKQVNFADSGKATNEINSWVEQQTNEKIKNLLQASDVDGDTSSVLVNAIYFKGLWKSPFSASATYKASFFSEGSKETEVEMMRNEAYFLYGDFPKLDATAVLMPYANSDLGMLVILPKKHDGLKDLETHLAKEDLGSLIAQMQSFEVGISLPKFKIEMELDLKEPLQKLGMSSIFEDNADFSGLFKGGPRPKISDARHKAYLEVNEAGSEAAAATFLKVVAVSLNLNEKFFKADHPFVFAILDSNAVYFAGHVAKF